MTKDQFKIVGLTSLGGALEFYDFTIYALFASYLSQHFFSNTNQLIALLNTFVVFALGYFARPLGGVAFGHLGDKFGRKFTFTLSVFIMATATLLMGCLPTYASIGITAPILLILLRLIQGFSVGGEIPGAAVFTIEHVNTNKRGFAIGLVFMSITLGNTIGACVGLILTTILSQDQMLVWGWRIPFIVGFLLGIISYLIRKKTIETPVFLEIQRNNQLHQSPFLEMIKLSPTKLLSAFLLTALTSSLIALFLYLPTYLSNIIKINAERVYFINIFAFLCIGFMTAFFGKLSDYTARTKIITTGVILTILFGYPLFYGLTVFGEPFLWIFILGFSIFGGMVNGSYVVLITELFPANLRYSAVGLSYSAGVAIFAGTGPIAFTGLIEYFTRPEAPVIYVLICAILTGLALILYSKALVK